MTKNIDHALAFLRHWMEQGATITVTDPSKPILVITDEGVDGNLTVAGVENVYPPLQFRHDMSEQKAVREIMATA